MSCTTHFNFGTAEHTYIRGGKTGAHVILNDFAGAGNVGIGTDAPEATLDVRRTAESAMNIAGSDMISHFHYGPDEHTYIRPGKYGSSVIMSDVIGTNVGIGMMMPTYKLDVAGYIRCMLLLEESDTCLKTQIRPLTNTMPDLLSLNAYKYQLKRDNFPGNSDQIGLLAQEVQRVFPELVKTDNTGILAVHYTGLIPILIEGIKEQQREIDELKKTVNSLLTGVAKKQ